MNPLLYEPVGLLAGIVILKKKKIKPNELLKPKKITKRMFIEESNRQMGIPIFDKTETRYW
jgi:hypothetical protein